MTAGRLSAMKQTPLTVKNRDVIQKRGKNAAEHVIPFFFWYIKLMLKQSEVVAVTYFETKMDNSSEKAHTCTPRVNSV